MNRTINSIDRPSQNDSGIYRREVPKKESPPQNYRGIPSMGEESREQTDVFLRASVKKEVQFEQLFTAKTENSIFFIASLLGRHIVDFYEINLVSLNAWKVLAEKKILLVDPLAATINNVSLLRHRFFKHSYSAFIWLCTKYVCVFDVCSVPSPTEPAVLYGQWWSLP